MPRILIRNATVVTMDPALGDLAAADVLIEDARIAAIEPAGRLRHAEAESTDGRGTIVIPGLINSHLHTWQTGLRGMASDWTLPEYFRKMHAGLATVFQPEDLHIATLVGALNQLNCGTTTLVDWCHNNPTPAHSDAGIDALRESGIRAAFLHGSPKPDPKPGERGFWETPHPRAELERLLKHRACGLIGVGAAILGPHYSTLEVALHDFAMARDLGVVASMHQGGGAPRTPGGWQRLDEAGLLGSKVNIVHGQGLSDDQLARFCSLGMSFSVTPEVEMAEGHGMPITGRLLKNGRKPALGVDLESAISGDMLTVARFALAAQRALDNAAYRDATGSIPNTSTIPAREALGWATLEGARMLGMEDRIGTLTPGKQADLVMIRADALNMQPVHDPAAAVVMQASIANIDSVMVEGRWMKRAGKMLAGDIENQLARLQRSGERMVSAMGLRLS
jgi:cytosine/adenosine deaminase-related metal-dependent hydrolase